MNSPESELTRNARDTLAAADDAQRRMFVNGVHGPTSAGVAMPHGTTRRHGFSIYWTDLGYECARLARLEIESSNGG